jgi:glucose-6-phosphate 1-dehydrogenase
MRSSSLGPRATLPCDEGLELPIIGVAKAGWSLDQLKTRAKDSLSSHGGLDPKAFARLTSLLRYVDGDY